MEASSPQCAPGLFQLVNRMENRDKKPAMKLAQVDPELRSGYRLMRQAPVRYPCMIGLVRNAMLVLPGVKFPEGARLEKVSLGAASGLRV